MAEPTIEQMERVAVGLGLEAMLMARSLPHYEQSLRNLHSLAQRALNGDEKAGAEIERLRAIAGVRLNEMPDA